MAFGLRVFSKRERERRGEITDYYIYDDVPTPCRVKLVYFTNELARSLSAHLRSHSWSGTSFTDILESFYDTLRYELCKTHGWADLAHTKERDSTKAIPGFLRGCGVEELMDFVEVLLFVYERQWADCQRQHYLDPDEVPPPEAAQDQLNAILKEHAIGYEAVEGQIVRVDSDFIHREAIREAITLLKAHGFEGPLKEFKNAITERDKGEPRQAIAEANNAFESTMKAVLDKTKVNYNRDKDSASALIQHLIRAGVLSPSLQNFAEHVAGVLRAGLPTLRNRQGGHGQGLDPVSVEPSYVNLAVHLAGTFIVFLIRRYEEHAS